MNHTPEPEPTIHWTEGKLQMWTHAKRAGAAEDLAEVFLQFAVMDFKAGDDDKAISLRNAWQTCRGWAKNERELQARLEKEHGGYDG